MFCQSLALGLLGSRVVYALKEPSIDTLVYRPPLSRCTTSRRKPNVEHDYSSNKTAGRKNGQVRHLVDFIFNRSTTPGRKKIDQVSDFAFFETSIKFFYLASAITKI